MNNNFYILNNLFVKRRKRLLNLACKRIEEGDYAPRSSKVLQDINLAVFENNATDTQLLGRFT